MEDYRNVVEGFQRHLRVRNYSQNSVRHYGNHLKGFFAWLGAQGVMDIRRVGKPLLRDYQMAMREWRGEGGKGYTWATRAGKLQAVRRLFEWLEEAGKILVNPAPGLAEPREGDRLPRNVLTEKQVMGMLEGVDLSSPEGLRDRAILEVFYSTGIRLSELTELALGDVDLVSGVVRVNLGKGAKDRVVPLGKEAARWLKEYVVKGRRHLTRRTERKTKRLWINKFGGPLSAVLIGRIVREHGAKVGLTISPHALRHTFATQLVKNGAPIEVVAKMLGHSDLRVTHKYARVAGVDLKKTQAATHPRERDKLSPDEMGKDTVEITSILERRACP